MDLSLRDLRCLLFKSFCSNQEVVLDQFQNTTEPCHLSPAGSVVPPARAVGPGLRHRRVRRPNWLAIRTAPSDRLQRMAGPPALKSPSRPASRAFRTGWVNGWPFRPKEPETQFFPPWKAWPEGVLGMRSRTIPIHRPSPPSRPLCSILLLTPTRSSRSRNTKDSK